MWGDTIDWSDAAQSVVWSDHLVWGEHLVWGDRVVEQGNTLTVLNGDNILWQSNGNNLNDQHLVWGDLKEILGLQPLGAWAPGVPDLPYGSSDPY